MMNEEQTSTTPPAPTKKSRSWISWVALLAILIALGAWFQLVHQQKRSTKNYSQLQSSFHQTLTDTAQLSQTITDLQTQIANQSQQLQALQATFNRMQAANSGYETDIALQQVDHYLLQANLTLTFNHDIASAIALLQAADQRLNAVPNAQVISLRQALASCIVKLQALPELDYVGILTKLNALSQQTATLPLFAITTKTQMFHNEPENPTNNSLTAAKTTWQKAWAQTLDTLKMLVVVRNRHEDITPLISDTQEQFLRQNLQLILQQASWAVLQHNQSVYTFSLTQASEWIQRYFADNNPANQAFQASIQQLQQVDLEPKLPDVGMLMNQLHALQLDINKSRILSLGKPAVKNLDEEDNAEALPSTDAKPAPTPSSQAPTTPTVPTKPKLSDSKGELV
jgi:uroporphyrin-3 C-methyltransferase